MRRTLAVVAGIVMLAQIASAQLWWERGADTWYYKDDWKAMAVTGANQRVTKTLDVRGGAKAGWIAIWGDRGYRLLVNGNEVGANVDGGLIDDYDLGRFVDGAQAVTLRIDGGEVCAEGEIVGRDGQRYPFATAEDWQGNGRASARKMQVAPNTGAFHRAHNGRLMTYNDEERAKTAIAKGLARIQKLNEQGIFLMKRLRPAEEIVSFDENAPWRTAENLAAPSAERAKGILKDRAAPAQKAGRFSDAIAAAEEAAVLLGNAEAALLATTKLYQAEREVIYLDSACAMIIPAQVKKLADGSMWSSMWSLALRQMRGLSDAARQSLMLRDFASAEKMVERMGAISQELRRQLRADAPDVVLSGLDEYPEDRFGWLNAREMIGNDPVNWPFVIAPSASAYLDLAGMWHFHTDPDNQGQKLGWAVANGDGWRQLFVPRPWERQGINEDNRKAPDSPIVTNDRFRWTTGEDKPYNGWAWYRKNVLVPAEWKSKPIVLCCGVVQNWGRAFVNGKALEPFKRPGEERGVAAATRVTIPQDLIEFGKENVIAIQVYNHDNFGGITNGPVALYVESEQPKVVETALPMGYAYEYDYGRHGRHTHLASAMSPGVVVAADSGKLELWGWEPRGHHLPETAQLKTSKGLRSVKLENAVELMGQDDAMAEGWILLRGFPYDTLIVPERNPQTIRWRRNTQGLMGLQIDLGQGPARAVVLCTLADTAQRLDPIESGWWEKTLRAYPVAGSQCLWMPKSPIPGGPLDCTIRYHYLRLETDGFGIATPTAPLPMLASFAAKYKHPDISQQGLRDTVYRSTHATYRVADRSNTISYSVRPVDRAKVMKGAGELFARKRAADNVHGGLGEVALFKRFADWGFDHCRYALAFDADWDLPMVANHTRITDDPAIWKRLDELIANCNAAGVQMMLCWFPEIGSRRWKDNPDWQKTTLEWWRRVAERYANLPEWAISYDPFNEPAYINTDHWNQIIRDLTASIRSVDKKHRIVWESADGWAQPQWCLWMQPVDDPNVMYSFHHYGKHWGYAYDEYYPSYRNTHERTHADVWLEAILFGLKHHVPIHCGEFGISMIQPGRDGEAWLDDYLAFFERFGIGWNWWNYSGNDIYRTGLAAADRTSPYVPILRKWAGRSGWGKTLKTAEKAPNQQPVGRQ